MKTLFGGVLKDRNIWQRELIAGVTAFFAISYIIIVNPLILADAGIPAELSVFATIFSSIIGCLINRKTNRVKIEKNNQNICLLKAPIFCKSFYHR